MLGQLYLCSACISSIAAGSSGRFLVSERTVVSWLWPCRKCGGHVQRQQGSASHSFLLDDDSSNPFNAAEVQLSMNDKELYSEMPVPEPLQGNKAFDFLQRDLKLSALAAQPAQ